MGAVMVLILSARAVKEVIQFPGRLNVSPEGRGVPNHLLWRLTCSFNDASLRFHTFNAAVPAHLSVPSRIRVCLSNGDTTPVLAQGTCSICKVLLYSAVLIINFTFGDRTLTDLVYAGLLAGRRFACSRWSRTATATCTCVKMVLDPLQPSTRCQDNKCRKYMIL